MAGVLAEQLLIMSARRDKRYGHWFYRNQIRTEDGRTVRIFGVPTTIGHPDTRAGAEEAERRHPDRVLKTGEASKTVVNPRKKPADGVLPKRSPKTVNNALMVLHRMLVVARKRGLIDFVPDFEWLRAPLGELDFLDFEEAARLINTAEGQLRTMIIVALRTGLRHGELLALRWQDVDLVAGRIVVRQNRTSWLTR